MFWLIVGIAVALMAVVALAVRMDWVSKRGGHPGHNYTGHNYTSRPPQRWTTPHPP